MSAPVPMLSPEIVHRDQFGYLCNVHGLQKIAVEIGVDRGEFARVFLANWTGNLYVAVDHWLPYAEMPWDRKADREMALQMLGQYNWRVRVLEHDSEKAAQFLRVFDRLEFLYVDACHAEEAVAKDLAIFWPLMAETGIFAGHDFDESHPGVVNAVTAFAAKENVQLYVTHESIPSWYCYKVPGTLIYSADYCRENQLVLATEAQAELEARLKQSATLIGQLRDKIEDLATISRRQTEEREAATKRFQAAVAENARLKQRIGDLEKHS